MLSRALTLTYNTEQYPFQKVLSHYVFKVRRLDQLHVAWRRQNNREDLHYQDNMALRRLMQRLPDDALFYKVYHAWIANVLAPRYGGKISYSAHPKMRVHLAGTGCVSDFHRDADVTGRLDQINCYLPFTDVFETCTVWCEERYDSNTYQPLTLKYGEALIWDGGLLKHGTYANQTDKTRVSCDFRFKAKAPGRVRSPWSDVLADRQPETQAEL
ncbi:streptomycin biosynthesis enzyme StrG [Hahella sp. HN01]|uniref:streptomycin biosynthesis enzyme StrG n=1 Tax=unclassified Hahella TaxID=2624107 RepID=UPI001C1EF790|nr:streptomycin biosynthesis enzyme StrG [Hahella sp. HN01]MBU6953466.1 streptomycin biosynthesis enzyme StrG [Hahella sp. HN01]